MEIVINECYGGFSLSKEAYEWLGLEWDSYGFAFNKDRTNKKLIECIEKIGTERASNRSAELEIVNIPDNATDWEISDYYDGHECVIAVVDGKLIRIDCEDTYF